MDQQKIVNTCISRINEWSIYVFKIYALFNIGAYQWAVVIIPINFCEVVLMLQASLSFITGNYS